MAVQLSGVKELVLSILFVGRYFAGLHTEGGRTGISPLQLEFPPQN